MCSANLLVEYSTVRHYFNILNSIEFWLFQCSIWLSCLLVQPVFELNFLVCAQYGLLLNAIAVVVVKKNVKLVFL